MRMKTLVIGLDGGDEQIIRNMEMPFLNDLLDTGTQYDVTEDLWSRGWASILNGLHGRETGAFYCKPSLDGEYGFTQSFGTPGHESSPTKPLWEIAMKNGYTVGIMNPPTTVPAPEVDGFFVSGAGGGYSPAGGIPEAACHPNSILETLEGYDCRWETRFTVSGIRNQDRFINEINETIENRTKAYLDLCEEYSPEFGFFVQKENVVIQNLFMSEIESIIGDQPQSRLQQQIYDFYTRLDQTIAQVVDRQDPDNLIIVSDHGQSSYRHTLNLNAFLKDIDVQSRPSSTVELPKKIARKTGKYILPASIKSKIKEQLPEVVNEITKPDVNWEESLAFSFRYIPGFYINDQERFGGPVNQNDIGEIIEMLINKFNQSSLANRHDLHAREYKLNYENAGCAELLPDVWIDHPDTVFFEAHGPASRPNERYGEIKDISSIDQDMYTGIKGENPILCLDTQVDVNFDDTSEDLTLAYEIIRTHIENYE